jgi:spoIIIJ-associated protein
MTEQHLNTGKQWLEKLLQLSAIPTTVDIEQPEGSNQQNCWLTIDKQQLSSTQIDLLIGSKGATIDAIQYLANASLNIDRAEDIQTGYIVELNGYRHQRAIELKVIADDAASQVRATGQEVVFQPMSSAERRQIHSFFDLDTNYSDLSTYSRGQEPDRRLVVKLVTAPEA